MNFRATPYVMEQGGWQVLHGGVVICNLLTECQDEALAEVKHEGPPEATNGSEIKIKSDDYFLYKWLRASKQL